MSSDDSIYDEDEEESLPNLSEYDNNPITFPGKQNH